METPRIPVSEKKKVVRSAFGSQLPVKLLHFLLLTIDKRRQRLLRDIARAFHELADEKLNRVNVEVTLARATDPDVITKLTDSLSALLGKAVVPHVRIKPEILGGVLVQAGDLVFDGSLRRRLSEMRQQLLSAGLASLREAE
jgi:F-type H+-transporting ATPase subunit delta